MMKTFILITTMALTLAGCRKSEDTSLPAQMAPPVSPPIAPPSVFQQRSMQPENPNKDSNSDVKRVLQTVEDVNRINKLNRDQAPKKQ